MEELNTEIENLNIDSNNIRDGIMTKDHVGCYCQHCKKQIDNWIHYVKWEIDSDHDMSHGFEVECSHCKKTFWLWSAEVKYDHEEESTFKYVYGYYCGPDYSRIEDIAVGYPRMGWDF